MATDRDSMRRLMGRGVALGFLHAAIDSLVKASGWLPARTKAREHARRALREVSLAKDALEADLDRKGWR